MMDQVLLLDQNLIDDDDDLNESIVKGNIPLKKTTNEQKSDNCNQCNYASAHAGHLRTHFKQNISQGCLLELRDKENSPLGRGT